MLDSTKMRSGLCLTLGLLVLTFSTTLIAQDRGVVFVSGPEFQLSKSAIDAGIDGSFSVSFEVDRTGAVKDVRILAGPIWPCDSTPSAEIKSVKEAVKENILASKFSPATKAGQTIDAEATLDFAIGEAYKEVLKKGPKSASRWVVDVGSLQKKATHLALPNTSLSFFGTASVRILIGETGKVIAAGTVQGPRVLQESSRRAACYSRFPPTVVDGKAIKATGVITYEYNRGYVTVR